MAINEMNLAEVEARLAEIENGLEERSAEELETLKTEIEELKARKTELEEIEARKAAAAALEAGAVKPEKTVEETREEEKTMTLDEIRSSAEYIEAYANYVKTGKDTEVRALLTTDASGVVPVPTMVDEIIRTAWDKEEIVSRVRKTYIRGNLKVAFERSADPAYVHNEGTTAPTEESLLLGLITLIPKNVKKWITVSDEALTMGGEAFLDYVYRELAHQITKKLADLVVADISGAQTSADGTHTAQAKITAAPSVTVIGEAFANLSDEAENPVVIMNKLTYANFLNAQAAASFAMDPFRGMPVLFNNTLPAYDSASATNVYAIVGDLGGAQVNFPEGDGVALKFDDLSLAESDMVKIVGRQYAAHGVTASGRFCRIAKPSGT